MDSGGGDSTKKGSIKKDPAWNHCISIDGKSRNGIYRLKHHLACTSKDVGACMSCCHRRNLESNVSDSENFRKKPSQEESVGGESSSIFKRRGSQSTIDSIFKKSEREDTCQQIVLFFYNYAIAFNVARSEEFTKVVEMIAKQGLGIKPPSYHEIWVKYLKQQVEKTNQILEEHRLCWKKYEVHTKKRNRLHQKTMNDVVFMMANSRLMKKKDVTNTKNYNIDELASDEEWTVEDNEANDAELMDDLDEVGEVEPMDDLEVPPIAADDEGHGIDNINENEDLVEENDDYPSINMKDFLG
ncbi:hypothetical protein PHAVU_001G085000 [Phaseolus vulgaris]|uniref:BED-type domain-containing protein n=1 Tax=Phaseolus vulgaris TaxID=3885 RepID=V7CTV5_PHAVU|nr:hypothetical protein PHAVU_001G085000g [Phaseolus vulgaris]ESW33617.1 hypothetical protein PHAVU_001G085000g [Phaseolus vulgaris]